MKVCKVCGQEKELSEFYKDKRNKDGHKNTCKSCFKEYDRKYYEENKEKKKEKIKEYQKENKEKIKEYKKEYRKENSQKKKEYMKRYYQENYEKIKEEKRKYRKENKQKANEYRKKKRKNDPLYRLRHNIRNMVQRSIKTKRTEEIIGCSFQELKQHLESQFTEGMSWDNYGDWHIDHKKPLSWYDLTNPEEVDKANHYSNLQPLWAQENLSKGNRFAS